MIRFVRCLAVLSLLAAAGCVTDSESSQRKETLMRISDAGVGPVYGSTAYSGKAIGAALTGFEIETVQATVNGDVTWLLAAFRDGLQVMRFVADGRRSHVAEIQVLSDAVPGPNGERVGMTFRETRGGRLNCVPGRAEWTGMAVCSSAGGRLRYVYVIPGFQGPAGSLPDRSALADAVLTRIVWHAG
ncbi:MAG: DUF1131 family protein [Hyphomicrobiales bacterium]|nr:DUF1131 family protein [Hyphomicrobiales bacterium]